MQPEPARKPTDPPPDPLGFITAVKAWMDEAIVQVAALREQVGTPSLGIDARALGYLTRIDRLLSEGVSDFDQHIPAQE